MGNGQGARGKRQWARGNGQGAMGKRQGQFFLILNYKIMAARNVRDTKVYRLAFELAMMIFEVSKSFPKEEKYSLIDQVRRSSRSVCANLAEAYRKKQYPAHFVAKISDADMENSETETWLQFALACSYISNELHDDLFAKGEEVGRLLNHIINNPEKY